MSRKHNPVTSQTDFSLLMVNRFFLIEDYSKHHEPVPLFLLLNLLSSSLKLKGRLQPFVEHKSINKETQSIYLWTFIRNGDSLQFGTTSVV